MYLLIKYNKKLFFFHVNIGKTKEWGYPIDSKLKHLYPNYSENIFNSINTSKIDTVFIDGRFRVGCTLSTILNCLSNNHITIIIHDFWNREQYYIVLKYLVEINRTDTMGIFKLKEDIDLKLVEQDFEIYKYIPD